VTDSGDLEARAAAGDPEAFGQLMQRTKASLYRFVHRYVGDADEAYDLVQEAYAAAWLAIRRYDPARPFDAWLFRIAINKCRDWSRRRRVRRWLLHAGDLTTPEAMAVPDGARDASETLATAQDLVRLGQAIANLPPQLKAPLILTAIEERSQAETAGLLGISVKAVETRVARARHRLADRLGSLKPTD
jgi:RNA polymerase sigma factor (sigma-70 family)